MARKRKIPARKHHGIRDPLKQQATQLAKLKGVTNNPPAKGGDQKISNRFAQFVKLANAAKTGKKVKRIRCGIEDKPREKKTGKATASTTATTASKIRPIKQLASETDEDYLRRVNRMTTESLKEAEYEAKYGVSVVRDPKTGAILIKKKPANEIDELIKRKKSRKPMEKKVNKMDPKEAKELIKQAIKEDNEETKKENTIKDFKNDVFKFGEVVHAPPTLTTLPRKAVRSETVPRPGMKDSLLLKSLMKGEKKEVTSKEPSISQKQKTPKKFKGKLKGKRKDLPAATRVMIEQEQNKIIDMYRQLKKNKQKSFET